MDPTATWRLVNDENADNDERDMAALQLLKWLAAGGFLPGNGNADTNRVRRAQYVNRAQVIEVCEHRICAAFDRTGVSP